MNDPLPYCMPHHRALRAEELALLRHLVDRDAPSRRPEIAGLVVVGRCGCGSCPTVMFGTSFEQAPIPSRPFRELAHHMGLNDEGVLVGVVLLEREGRISELEAWSPWGAPVRAWPRPQALSPADHFDR